MNVFSKVLGATGMPKEIIVDVKERIVHTWMPRDMIIELALAAEVALPDDWFLFGQKLARHVDGDEDGEGITEHCLGCVWCFDEVAWSPRSWRFGNHCGCHRNPL